MRFLVVAGGTGGHISPGIALYKEIKKRNNQVLFVTNPQGLKFPLIRESVSNSEIITIPISRGLSKNFLKNLTTLKEFLASFFISLKILLSFDPEIVILTGGYTSGPIGLASLLLRKKIVLLEQNSVMGTTNRLMSLFASKIILSFPLRGKKRYSKKYEVIGNPVRYSDEDRLIKDYAKSTYGFSGEDKVVGIILGSQGAKRVNEVIMEIIEEVSREYKIIWATGQDYYEAVFKKCKNLENVRVFPFINNINVFMSAIDAAVARAGASTLAELSFFGVPGIFIPFPYASKNHQYYNALFFETKGAGIVVKESELTGKKLLSALELIFKNLDTFRRNAEKVFPKNVTQEVIHRIISLT